MFHVSPGWAVEVSGSGAVAVVVMAAKVTVKVMATMTMTLKVLEADHSAVGRFVWFEAIVDVWEADNQEEEESQCFAVVRGD